MSISIGEYLLTGLSEMRVHHMFGVPGDFNLWFLEQTVRNSSINFVGCCNELNAAYAADGCSRLAGISALATTYGVGELASLSGVAGAYAERVPIVCIPGAPPLPSIQQRALLHHTLSDGNYENMLNCYREFTVAQARIEPANARQEIDRSFGHAGSKNVQCIFSFPPMWQVSELNRLPDPWISLPHLATQDNSLAPFQGYSSVYRKQELLHSFSMRIRNGLA